MAMVMTVMLMMVMTIVMVMVDRESQVLHTLVTQHNEFVDELCAGESIQSGSNGPALDLRAVTDATLVSITVAEFEGVYYVASSHRIAKLCRGLVGD